MPNASKIGFTEGDAPATPGSGISRLYPKTDHLWYTKDSAGTERQVSSDLTLTALATGFSVAGGTTSKSLTVELDSVINQDLSTDSTTVQFGQITVPSVISPAASLVLKPTTDGTTAIQLADKDGNAVLTVDTTNNYVGVNGTPGARFDVWDGNFTLSDSDVAHGITDLLPTNVFGKISPMSGTAGGLSIWGASDDDATAIDITGFLGIDNPTDSMPAVMLRAGKKNGTAWQAIGAAETVLKVVNYATDLITVLGSGNVGVGVSPLYRFHSQGSSTGSFQNIGFFSITDAVQTGLFIGARNTPTKDVILTAGAYGAQATNMILSTNDSGGNRIDVATLDSAGNVLIGATSAGTSLAKGLVIGSGTAPTAHVDDAIQIFSVDSSDATATLGLFLEQAVEDIGTFTPSHKVKIKINGTEYWLQLDAV